MGNLRPFRPGQSGNPGGRPKSLSVLICEQTMDGRELVAFMLNVLRGRRKAPLKLRMEAAAWLADRGFGKAVQTVEVDASVDATVTHREALRAHVEEADVERLTRALLGSDGVSG